MDTQRTGLVIALDFDGVLAVPYSQPEVLFAGTESLLRDLSKMGHTLIVTSFNPRAYPVLKPLLDQGIISAIRAGSCVRWWEEEGGVYKNKIHRRDMEKSLHLDSMLEEELRHVTVDHIFFIDDDMRNIDNVTTWGLLASFLVSVQYVPSYAGVGWSTMSSFLNKYNE